MGGGLGHPGAARERPGLHLNKGPSQASKLTSQVSSLREREVLFAFLVFQGKESTHEQTCPKLDLARDKPQRGHLSRVGWS